MNTIAVEPKRRGITPARFRWGVILVLIGGVMLLHNLGVLNSNFWADFLIYAPAVLIAIGIEKIFTRTRFEMVSYATSLVILVGGLWLAFSGSGAGGDAGYFEESTFSIPADPSIRTLQATIELGEDNLTIREATDELVYGEFGEFTRKPSIDTSVINGIAKLGLKSTERRFFGGALRVNTGDHQDWYLSFSEMVPLELDVSGRESDIHLNFATTPLKRLVVGARKGAIYVKLGTLEPSVDVTVSGEDSDVRLRFPSSSGIKLTGMDDSDYLNQIGFQHQDGYFVNPGYDSSTQKINVELDDRVSSLSIDYY